MERKVVTVLFTDVTGSTQLADRLDVEELQEVMSEWFAAVRGEIVAQGGTVEKYIGDAVMAVFGVPNAHEDDPSRALRAALAIRGRLVEVNESLERTHGITMQIRTGINTGEAVATPNPAPGEALVTGIAVNAAARLEQLAEPGQTVVAERTARAAPGFEFADLGTQQLRGKEEAVRAFLLVGETPDAQTRGLPGMHAPLVGRDRELDLLLTLYERAVAEGRPQLVTVYGDPGVGKSRLVRELLGALRMRDAAPRIVVGRCLSYGDGVAYWPLAEILKSLGGISDEDSAPAAVERVVALADDVLAGQPDELRSLAAAALAFTLGLDTGNPDFARLAPSAIRIELHRAWRMLLSTLAERMPLVVVVDDIHWADDALLDLLEELAERGQGALLFVCPARPELTGSRPTWGGGRRNFSSVFLSPLSEDDAAALVSFLLDVDGLREDTRRAILARAEGNPFFVEEILRQLIDERRIVREEGRWRATDGLASFELPDTVQGVLAARIDLLQPREKRTLQQASVVGRIFWRGAVAALIDDDASLDPDLRRLEERELVASRLSSSMVGEEELAFSHILTRDVAYESLPRRERPRAHARVARWIEDTAGDRQREYGALLAHHYLEAYRGARRDRAYPADELEALRLRALELLLHASHTASRGAVFAAARSLADAAAEVASTPEEHAAALTALGDACSYRARGDEAWAAYSEAADLLREAGSTDGERVALLYARALETVTRWPGTMRELPAEDVAKRYRDHALAALPPREGEARVRILTAQSFWGHAYPRTSFEDGDPVLAEERGNAAVEMALRLGRPDLAVAALDGVQHNFQRRGLFEQAHATALRRLEIARGAGDLAELGDSYAVAAWNAVYLGAFREAAARGHEGFELLQRDAPMYAMHALCWATVGEFYLGDWDAVLRDFEVLQSSIEERGGLTSGFAMGWPAAAHVLEARGERAASERVLREIYDVEEGRGALSPGLSQVVVRTLVLRGDLVPARARLDAVALESDDDRESVGLLQLACVELLIAEESWDELDRLASSMREFAAASGARYLLPAADRAAGRAALAAGRRDDATRLLGSAVAGYDDLGMAVDAAVARLDLAEVLGGGADVAPHVAAARETFARAGFASELARAERLSA